MAQGKKKKKDPILVAFAAAVRKRRHVLSLTQEELAERAGFHVNYIGGIERAERNPSLTSLVALTKGLDCSIKDLVPKEQWISRVCRGIMAATAHNRKKTKIQIAFGQKVRSRRHAMSMTIEELAEVADLHYNYIGSVERGERNISLENIIALAKALKCSAKDLIPE